MRQTTKGRRAAKSSAGSHRDQESENRREAILHAAQVEFCERGYDDTTISRIARRANVADGTIYKYVADKRELLFRVLARVIGTHVAETIRIAEQIKTATEKLEYFCYRHLAFWDQNRKLSLLYAAESRTRDRLHWPTYRDVNRDYVKLVQRALDEGIASGEFRVSVSAKYLRDMIIGSVEQIAWVLTSGDHVIEPQRMARDVIQVFLKGIQPASSNASRDDLADRLARTIERLDKKLDELGQGGIRAAL